VHSILNHPRYGPKSPLGSNMYTYLKFGLPRVFPPNGSQRSHRAGPGPGQRGRGRVNRGYNRDSAGAGSSGYDSSDNETTRGRVPPNLRKFRSESDFRTLNGMMQQQQQQQQQHSRPGSRIHNNIPITALKQPNSRASIAGTHINNYPTNSRYHNNRSHSEADLLGGNGPMDREMFYDYDSRIYGETRDPRSRAENYSAISNRRQSSTLIYPNIQIHCLDIDPDVRGISMQAKAGDLFAIMATSSKEGTALVETIAGLRERLGGEILINGQQVSKRMLRQLCGYVPAIEVASLDPRMSVQNTLNYHAALKGPLDKSDLKERVRKADVVP
jgi:ABC-type glutathione transport system ATPase component